jgi:polyisoprenoid-binding protein YceI
MSIIQRLLSILGLKSSNKISEKEALLQKIKEQRAGKFPVLKDWQVDYYHSSIKFRVMHMGIVEVLGKFKEWKAEVQGTSPSFTDLKIKTIIQTNSIETDFAARDMHLKSPDFFDVEKFSTIEFQSTKINWRPLKYFDIQGNLTIKGITKTVNLEGQIKNFLPKDMFGFPKIGFLVTGQINRKDWGLNWQMELESGDLVIDDWVKLEIEVELATPQGIQAMENMLKQMQAN